ncbi:Uncharacterized protein YcnI [Nocardioides alpinus]|uniref:DUF1775 domain-containing protein n=1 Tax=Nocardioides alpinus TaxID=748909 RepID=A0A1I0Y944_9ACTN|nr:DUF1775 domain-containing protein [Nocardioides alpinus]PKH39020.1 DUF1775 domain-containing protein [Nocardioides alpinus]SFB08968.1 Uncharacterized protein YcnI [Nocardioides alpinus]
MNRTRTARRAALASLATGAVTSGLLALAAAPAAAHVTITASTTEAGATAVVRLVVPHGCAGAATTEVAVRMPDGVSELVAASTEQWSVERTAGGVTYLADAPLPDATRDEVAFTVRLPDDVGAELVFPVVQRCEDGESAWTEVAEDAASREELEMPAPVIVVTGDPARPVMTYGAVGALAAGTLAAGAVLLLRRRRA